MKKTNVALFHSATKWMRLIPLLLCFIVFSSSDLAAQNFKSPENATVAVKEALEQVMDDLDPTVERYDQMTQSQQTKNAQVTYFKHYLDSMSDLNDTQGALAKLDKIFPVQKMGPMEDTFETLREELVDLITD